MTINYNGTIKSLRDIVWGVVTNPLSQIEQITLLIFIKLLSERHNELERMESKKLIFTGEFASYHFDSLTRLTGYELVDTVRKAIESLYKNPNIEEPIRRLYERSYLQVNDPRVLSLLINEINKIDIKSIDMGDFYEHLLAVLGTQKEAGQFRTPRHLIKFIVDVVDPQVGERVLDPACGTAGFLTASFIHIRDTNTSKEAKEAGGYLDKLNLDQKTFLINKTIYGYDIDPNMIKFAISNLYLHSIKNPNISQHNTLTSNDGWEERYDVILTNPPFSTPKGGVKPTDRFTLNSKRTEVLFVEYVIEHLTLNGRAGVIVPEGIIFQSGKAYKELRKWLVENNYLYAVVSLPSGVFNPYSGVKTSILFLDREKARQTDKILFCKVENDGFDLGAQRRPINKNDLPKALEIAKTFQKNSRQKIEDYQYWNVEKKEIAKSGDYNFSGERYREAISFTNQKFPIIKLGEVCDFQGGSQPPKSTFIYQPEEDYIKFVQIRDFGEKGVDTYIPVSNKNKLCKTDDVLIARYGASLGRICTGLSGAYNVALLKSLPNTNRLLKKYLYFLLNSEPIQKKILQLGSRAAQAGVRPEDLKDIKIPLLPLSVQQEIVEEIDGYQKIIEGAKQVIENYEPRIKYLSDWPTDKLGTICKFEGGTQPPKSTFINYPKEGYIRLLQIRDYKSDESAVYIPIIERHKTCTEKDIMIGRYGPPVFQILRGKSGAYNVALMKCLPDNHKITNDWLYYFLQSDPVQKKIIGLSQRVRQSGVRPDDLDQLDIPLPSIEIQKQIIAQVEEEQKLVEANKKLIQLFEQKIKDKIAEIWGEKDGNI